MKQFRGSDLGSGKFELQLEEVMKVKRWFMHVISNHHMPYCIFVSDLYPTLHVPFCSRDILGSVIIRTRILMDHIAESPNAELLSLYVEFQDESEDLLSECALSYSKTEHFMPYLLRLWRSEDLLTLNTNKLEIQNILDK
jgi:hypothetical protein